MKHEILKGTIQRHFWPPFFNPSNLPGPQNNGIKKNFDWLRFRWVILNLVSKKLSPRQVKQKCYPINIYQKCNIQLLISRIWLHIYFWDKGPCKHFKSWLLTPRGHELVEWLPGVAYPGEIDSGLYDSPKRFLQKNWLTRRNLNQNQKYFYPLVSGPGSKH